MNVNVTTYWERENEAVARKKANIKAMLDRIDCEMPKRFLETLNTIPSDPEYYTPLHLLEGWISGWRIIELIPGCKQFQYLQVEETPAGREYLKNFLAATETKPETAMAIEDGFMGGSIKKYPRTKQDALDFTAKILEFKQNMSLLKSYLTDLGAYNRDKLNSFLKSIKLVELLFDSVGGFRIKTGYLWHSFSDIDVQNLMEDIKNGEYDRYFMDTNKNGDTFNIGNVIGKQVQIGGSDNTINTTACIREKLKERGVPEQQIKEIEPQIAEIAAECDKETVNQGKLRAILSGVETVIRDIFTQVISQIIAGKIGG
jgi:hypothetical protein